MRREGLVRAEECLRLLSFCGGAELGGLGKGLLFRSLDDAAFIDFYGSFEVGSILNRHALGDDVTAKRSVLRNLDAFLGLHVSFDLPADHNFTRDDIPEDFSRCVHRDSGLLQTNESLKRTIDFEVFDAGNLAPDMQSTLKRRSTGCLPLEFLCSPSRRGQGRILGKRGLVQFPR